ncbi:hypothetical protein CDO52_26200 [Nocardiopsis gilva YIM 90087]|uniref:Uncharacterized protein n=1 Tax=Nocardiopsis gilva YIM 90087 TaxID=1235441 RepID=A0A223SCE8_9ACTN|nr:hypothetical protein [Nocardiopsis gilva]ASU85827.1 hypothetical protein CDO52_26200 [Nocardiopsis gilva YIM 90087]
MNEATSARRQRIPLRFLLLSLVVLVHFLCSVCHAAAAVPDDAADASAASVAASSAGPTADAVASRSADDTGTSAHAADEDMGVDQRLIAPQMLLMVGLGVLLIAALWLAPPQAGHRLLRRFRAVPPGGPPILLSLCIQRV